MKRRTGFLAMLALGACAAPAPPVPHAAEGAKSEAPRAGSEPSESATAPEPETGEPKPAASTDSAGAFDLDDFAAQHQMKIELVADGCEPAELGDHPSDVIWCAHHQEQALTVVQTRALYAARNKRLVKLVELPVAVSLLPGVEGAQSETDLVRMRLGFTRDKAGKSLEVREASGFDCASARAKAEEDKAATPALYKELAAALDRICAQRGTWTWAGGSLRLTRRF